MFGTCHFFLKIVRDTREIYMNRKDFWLFLVLELIAIFWAGAVFRIFDSRLLAGAMAGSYFAGFGLFMLWRLVRAPDTRKYFSLYPLLIHVFVISLPMMAFRFYQYSAAFEDVKIWGLEGPVFHRLSTTVFSFLIVATIVDLIRSKKA